MKKAIFSFVLLLCLQSASKATVCQCSNTDYFGSLQANFTITYNSFGSICDPCGATQMSLTLSLYDPTQNDDYVYTGSPSLYAINFLCGSQCISQDWLYA